MKIERTTEVTNSFYVELDESEMEDILAEIMRQKIVEQHGPKFAKILVDASIERDYSHNCFKATITAKQREPC